MASYLISTICQREPRVGVAMAAGLGAVGLSMVVAHVKNMFGGKL